MFMGMQKKLISMKVRYLSEEEIAILKHEFDQYVR